MGEKVKRKKSKIMNKSKVDVPYSWIQLNININYVPIGSPKWEKRARPKTLRRGRIELN